MRPVRRSVACALAFLAWSSAPAEAAAPADPALPRACAVQLTSTVVGLACAPGAPAVLRAKGLRAGRELRSDRALRPGTVVTVEGRLGARSHVVLLYSSGSRRVYVRFTGLRPGRDRRVRITSRLRGGRVLAVARVSGVTRAPTLSRTVAAPAPASAGPRPTAPAGPAAPPAPVTSAPSTPVAGSGLRPDTLTPSGGGGCAVRDPALDAQWTRSGPGWTGADATYSVALPDGRDLWLFGDTLLGTVSDAGTRSPDSPFIRNSGVVRSGEGFRTLHGGTDALPATWLQTGEADTWYWPGDATVEGDRVRVLVSKVRRTGPGAWDFATEGTDLVTLSLPDLRVTGVAPRSAGRVAWGAAILEDASWTYVYGVEGDGLVKHAHVARAPRGALAGAWEYRTPTGWSPDESASTRIFSGVSDQFSVLRRGDAYLLLTQDSVFGRDIRLSRSAGPAGGWSASTSVYSTPSWGPGTFTYNALAHPELSVDGDLVVSYNVNSFDPSALHERADAYRPRFVRVPAACL